MRRERGNRDERNSNDRFDGPRGFASHRSMMSSVLGGKDPFDDPFFNRPFGSMFEPSIGSFDDLPHTIGSSSKGLVIEELDSDDDESEIKEGKNGDSQVKDIKAHKGPLIEHPDDEGIINMTYR